MICVMVEDNLFFSRRAFLKLAGLNLAALALPVPAGGKARPAWPRLKLENLPPVIQNILTKVPRTHLAADGYLLLLGEDRRPLGRVPVAQTLWNIERSRTGDRLTPGAGWGIVLHWYGDRENFDKTVDGYLRGFNSLRRIGDYITRTSAHFLIGPEKPSWGNVRGADPVGILQTQVPDRDGTPFLASHLQPLDYSGHREGKQYFVRALYQLGYQEAGIHSLLQDLFDGPVRDPNFYTVAIEICGYDFDTPQHFPSQQQLANLLSVVWAVMKRYRIPASNLLGHHEIQLGKADPGKKFMAFVRYALGIIALVENDDEMKELVFGQFLAPDGDTALAVRKYFKFVRDYLVMVASQRDVYEWEAECNYWLLAPAILNSDSLIIADSFHPPIYGNIANRKYLHPENHEGVDFLVTREESLAERAYLVTNGVCLYVGEAYRCQPGKIAIFRHCQPDGAQILTIYSNLSALSALKVGERYTTGYPVGILEDVPRHATPSLHFAVAYGATWDTDLKVKPSIPINTSATWIRARYIDPTAYLQSVFK